LAAALLLFAAAHLSAQPLPRSTPEQQGISSAAIRQFVEEAEATIDHLHSVMVVRHGQVVAEGWWSPYAAGEPHVMYSISKSFASTGVGLAAAEGLLSLDDPVLKFFPDEAPAAPSANLKAMRVRDLLTMSTGHHEEDIRAFPYFSEESLVKLFLAIPVAHKPGTHFVYNTPASYMLSAIVQKVSGRKLVDYLKPRLFDPLGIVDPTWDESRQGVSLGGFGLNIRTEDIARFGLLYLWKGQWQGKQILSPDWIAAATSRQVSNGSSPGSDWEQGYGFQFWRSRHGYRGDGAHGQFCLVLPKYDAVIAITAGTRDMASVMNLVWKRLLPAMADAPLPADETAHRALTTKLAGLVLPAQTGGAAPAIARSVSGRAYELERNAAGWESVRVNATDRDAGTFEVRIGGAGAALPVGNGEWKKGTWTFMGREEPVAASGGWTGADTYTVKVVRYRTPYVLTYRLRFDGDRVEIEREQNATIAGPRVATFVGTAVPAPSSAGR
jgi:CubicO group peptidase (beta-lactamase class C family)